MRIINSGKNWGSLRWGFGVATMLLAVGLCWSADNQSDIAKRMEASARVLNEVMATPDKAIPEKVMRDAKCVAVIPSMVNVALGFGGSYGKGLVTCRDRG